MTRFLFDQFAKDYLEELLSAIGQVQLNRKVRSEIREIDLWFVPDSQPTTDPNALGLLGQLAATPAIFEPFHNSVTVEETESCLLKLLDLRLEQRRVLKRDQRRLPDSDRAKLWILTPTASDAFLQNYGVSLDLNRWGAGIYLLPEPLATAFVVIHRLPKTPATLWLRLLGKGRVQQQAIAELRALTPEHPLRASALELLLNLRVTLEARQDLEPEAREFIMRLSAIYQERLSQALEQGIQQGAQQGAQQERRQISENLLRTRFGSLDTELLAAIEQLIQLPAEELAPLLIELSRQGLLAKAREMRASGSNPVSEA